MSGRISGDRQVTILPSDGNQPSTTATGPVAATTPGLAPATDALIRGTTTSTLLQPGEGQLQLAGPTGDRSVAVQQQLDKQAHVHLRDTMPLLSQGSMPSCGTTCLSMALEYFGIPAHYSLIDPYIRPYGAFDAGETPAELGRYARLMGLQARTHDNGSLEDLAGHIRQGRAVTCFINYQPPERYDSAEMGHLVNVIGVERDASGEINLVHIRNPWGRDETMSAESFMEQWDNVRITARIPDDVTGMDKLGAALMTALPVFDRSYVVIDSPDKPALPLGNPLDDLASAPTDLVATTINAFGGARKTIDNGHVLAGVAQASGAVINSVTGAASMLIGNLIGKNIEQGGEQLLEVSRDLWQGDTWHKVGAVFVGIAGAVAKAVGWLLSMIGGLLATASDLATRPLTQPARLLNQRDMAREHVLAMRDREGEASVLSTMARGDAGVQLALLDDLVGHWPKPEAADQEAALLVIRAAARAGQLAEVVERFGGAERLQGRFDGDAVIKVQQVLGELAPAGAVASLATAGLGIA